MAPKATKRAASQAPKEVRIPKVKKANPMLDSLIETVDAATDLPDAVKAMLIAVIPGSFLTPSAERHESQAATVRMVGEVVEARLAKLKQDLDIEQARVDGADTKKADLETAVTTAETSLTDADAVVEAKRLSLNAAAEVTAERQQELSQAESAQREGNVDFEARQHEKDHFETAFEKHFKALRDGTGEDAEGTADSNNQYYDLLLPLVSKISLDESLLTALPSSAKKVPSARGPFDHMVIQQLEQSLSEHIARLREAVEAAAPAAEERSAAVEVAKAALEQVKLAEAAAEGELNIARTAREEASERVTTAKEAVEKFLIESKSFSKVRDEKEKALRNFEQYDLECYMVARDKSREVSVAKDVTISPAKPAAVEVAGA